MKTVFSTWVAVVIAITALSLAGVPTEANVPDWCSTEWHVGCEECGMCGEPLLVWREVQNYAETDWVPVCGSCWECVAEETQAHRDWMVEVVKAELAERSESWES